MASQWGESISLDYGDLQANTMAVDCLGKWAVLAGRRVLALVDLDSPSEKMHRLTRQSKWDISCIQWNPHASHAQLFSAACKQRLDLFSWEDGSIKQVCSMKAHSRNISDIDWSPFDVNVIASCSVDAYTLLWDVRDTKRPSASFQSVCGATQVKWNKVTNNLFATAHEGDVRIWDPRKGNAPVLYLTAHLSKIHGLDWSPSNEHIFASSSQDCSVKFWDYSCPKQDKGTLISGSPVWRARFTPFGDGLVTAVMSTLRRGENSLFLWSNSNLDQPVHQFIGHSDVVLEFQWRKKDESSRDYQLVTWSKDQSLKIWKVDTQLQRLCGHDTLDSSESESTVHDSSETIKENGHAHTSAKVNGDKNSHQSESMSHQQPMTLYQEFSMVNQHIPNVTIDKMDGSQRLCSVSVNSGKHIINLTIHFPANYPHVAAPNFEIVSPTNVGSGVIKKLYKVLNETSQTNIKRNLNCLEPCIRQFATHFENMTLEERKTPDSDTFAPTTNKLQQSFMQQLPFAAFQDYSIPFPRTCGAQFNSAGLLVCFGRSREASKGSEKTPKALSELAAYTSTNRVRSSQSSSGFSTMFSRSPPTPKAEPVSISTYYMFNKRQRTKSRNYSNLQETKWKSLDRATKKEKKSVKLEPVRIYDTHCLLNIHRDLAEKYSLDVNNIEGMCEHNKKEAAAVGRKDLVRLWSLIPITCNTVLTPSSNPDDGIPWAQRPFGRKMYESLMEYYKSIHDVQTLAMICCIFWDKKFVVSLPQSSNIKKSSSKASLDYVPPNMELKFGSSSDSGWNLLPKALREQKQEPHDDDTAPDLEAASLSPSSTVTSPNISNFLTRAMVKIRRSNSLSDFSFEDYRFAEEMDPKEKAEEIERKQHENNCRILDPSKYTQYDHFLKVYADILYRWGLRNQYAHIMKHVTVPPEPHAGIEFGVQCHYCKAEVRGVKCGTCKMKAFRCVICHTGVTGTSNFCLNCGHGGHAAHMKEWFRQEEVCPTGCGCQCLKWNPF
ncbi:GATOR complex protein WDR59-like isoform X3 [Mercenaria mercenaria]|uniref:GATOR complex protein WDR59-like isoform X3 n=1 Tax=Mercenaria mercenaria TaxID=6596 RepID=UPI00234F685D|nr:GATOR complex protein WDR59-like isoform X3 [Mercenaria mercenaria]